MPARQKKNSTRMIAAILALLVVLVAGGIVAGKVITTHAGTLHPAILVDAQAACAADPARMENTSSLTPDEKVPALPTSCRRTRFGNGETGIFHIPSGAWGIAWAYHCPKPSNFYVVVHLGGLDGTLPTTGVYRHGRGGRGYLMETHLWQVAWSAIAPQWRDPQDLTVKSTCSWHVRVVKGSAAVVARNVPAIPGTA